MKKVTFIFSTILFAAVIFSGCGSGIESDAKKVAALQCKAQKLMQKAASGDLSVLDESNELAAEVESMISNLEGKYSSMEDMAEFEKAYRKELRNCD